MEIIYRKILFFSELEFFFRYSFDVELLALSIGGEIIAIRALLPDFLDPWKKSEKISGF